MSRIVRFPTRDPMPAWYELSVESPGVFRIRIHRIALDWIQERCVTNATAPLFNDMIGAKLHGRFRSPVEGDWGLGGVLKVAPSGHPDWAVYDCHFPVLWGRMENRFSNAEVMIIRSTLFALFFMLHSFNGEDGGITDWLKPQLIVVDSFSIRNEMNGGALYAALTPTTVRWLAQWPDEYQLEEVRSVLIEASEFMWPDPSDHTLRSRFQVVVREGGRVHMTVPGNSCGLDPSLMRSNEPGCMLSPHNVDSSLQQLTLLMGLAKLHDLARQ